MAYLRCTTDFRIGGIRTRDNNVIYYSDSDHAGDRELSLLSRTGSMIMLNGVPVQWRSRLQNEVSFS